MSGTLLDTPSPEQNRRPTTRPVRFWTEYRKDPANPGQMRAVDMVRWVRLGDLSNFAMDEPVERLRRPLAESEDGERLPNPAWLAVEPSYQRWKAGQSIVEEGTPLEAWPAVNAGQVGALKAAGLGSVEALAEVQDSALNRVPLPDVRQLRDLARAFIANRADSSRLEAVLAERDTKQAALEAELAELRALLTAQQEIRAEPAPAPPRRPRTEG